MTPAVGEFLLILVFLLIVPVIVVLAVLQWRKEKKRRQALQALAHAQGWTYLAKDTQDIPLRYRGYEPFDTGHSRYAHNILRGARGEVPFEVFDYHYAVTTSNGKTTTTSHYHHRVCTVAMPMPGPALVIRDEHLGHKIFDALGGEDIDFESHEFSRRFWVRSDDRRFAYDVIHTGMMEFLLGLRGWVWQWRGQTLLLYNKGSLQPADVRTLLELVEGFRALLPRHLVPGLRARG